MNSIGIGISTTPNRDIIYDTIQQFKKYWVPDSILRISMDKDYTGVAANKNRLIAELDNCDHIFLFDDDCYPIADNWWVPYIESGQNHLMYQFKLKDKPLGDMRILYQDDKLISYTHTRGAMIYITKKILDTVGGFDEAYEGAYFEHPDYTNRIHNAGLTTHRAADIVGSDKLLYCLDQDAKVESSISDDIRKVNMIKNYQYYRSQRNSKEYKAYK